MNDEQPRIRMGDILGKLRRRGGGSGDPDTARAARVQEHVQDIAKRVQRQTGRDILADGSRDRVSIFDQLLGSDEGSDLQRALAEQHRIARYDRPGPRREAQANIDRINAGEDPYIVLNIPPTPPRVSSLAPTPSDYRSGAEEPPAVHSTVLDAPAGHTLEVNTEEPVPGVTIPEPSVGLEGDQRKVYERLQRMIASGDPAQLEEVSLEIGARSVPDRLDLARLQQEFGDLHIGVRFQIHGALENARKQMKARPSEVAAPPRGSCDYIPMPTSYRITDTGTQVMPAVSPTAQEPTQSSGEALSPTPEVTSGQGEAPAVATMLRNFLDSEDPTTRAWAASIVTNTTSPDALEHSPLTRTMKAEFLKLSEAERMALFHEGLTVRTRLPEEARNSYFVSADTGMAEPAPDEDIHPEGPLEHATLRYGFDLPPVAGREQEGRGHNKLVGMFLNGLRQSRELARKAQDELRPVVAVVVANANKLVDTLEDPQFHADVRRKLNEVDARLSSHLQDLDDDYLQPATERGIDLTKKAAHATAERGIDLTKKAAHATAEHGIDLSKKTARTAGRAFHGFVANFGPEIKFQAKNLVEKSDVLGSFALAYTLHLTHMDTSGVDSAMFLLFAASGVARFKEQIRIAFIAGENSFLRHSPIELERKYLALLDGLDAGAEGLQRKLVGHEKAVGRLRKCASFVANHGMQMGVAYGLGAVLGEGFQHFAERDYPGAPHVSTHAAAPEPVGSTHDQVAPILRRSGPSVPTPQPSVVSDASAHPAYLTPDVAQVSNPGSIWQASEAYVRDHTAGAGLNEHSTTVMIDAIKDVLLDKMNGPHVDPNQKIQITRDVLVEAANRVAATKGLSVTDARQLAEVTKGLGNLISSVKS